MKSYRENPDGEENARATRENKNAVRAATLASVKPVCNDLAESCPFCGKAEHGALSFPTVTCTRNLWADKAELLAMLERVFRVMPARMEEGGELLEGHIAALIAKAKGGNAQE